jgi:hypothetical protein
VIIVGVVIIIPRSALRGSKVIVRREDGFVKVAMLETYKFSEPVGTKTPSASRYEMNWSGRYITVDFMDNEENVENQLEN